MSVGERLYNCDDPDVWRGIYGKYWDVVEAKSSKKGKGAGKLLALDKWFEFLAVQCHFFFLYLLTLIVLRLVLLKNIHSFNSNNKMLVCKLNHMLDMSPCMFSCSSSCFAQNVSHCLS